MKFWKSFEIDISFSLGDDTLGINFVHPIVDKLLNDSIKLTRENFGLESLSFFIEDSLLHVIFETSSEEQANFFIDKLNVSTVMLPIEGTDVKISCSFSSV